MGVNSIFLKQFFQKNDRKINAPGRLLEQIRYLVLVGVGLLKGIKVLWQF
jgi:hypothetical protein